jgi:hypothetical protein
MRHAALALCLTLALAARAAADATSKDRAARAKRDADARAAGLVMHEWGAVTYAQGIDAAAAQVDAPLGQTTADLPEFAQVWTKLARQAGNERPNILPGGVRIEIVKKPIVYFYTDKPATVSYTVAIPSGLITQWSPKAWKITPDPATYAGPLDVEAAVANGGSLLRWKNIDLVPPKPDVPGPEFPAVPDTATWWPVCRDTDATPINVNGQWEKFLFYRGLIANVPPVVTVDGGGKLNYTLTNTSPVDPVKHLLMVHVADGKGAARYISTLEGGQTLTVAMAMPADAKPVAEFAERTREHLADVLEQAGLFPKESAGMTRIWRKAWFETDGVRLIYLNPPLATASLMPAKVDPVPASAVRTILIAVECLKDSRENVIKRLIGQLGDGAYPVREAAYKKLITMAKTAEPALRAALKTAEDDEVRNRITKILGTLDPRAKVEAEERERPRPPGEQFDR